MSESAHTSQTPALPDIDNAGAITTGCTFQFAVEGEVSAVRFFAPENVGGTYTVGFWEITADDDPDGSGTGTLLGTAAVAGGSVTPADWNSVAITPVAVDPAKYYRAATHASAGRYVATGGAFNSGPITNGNVTLIQTGISTALGTLANGNFDVGGSLAYPANTFNGNDYFADVEFDEAAPADVDGFGVGAVAVAGSATGTKETGAAGVGAAGVSGTAVGSKDAVGLGAGSLAVTGEGASTKTGTAIGLGAIAVAGTGVGLKQVASAGTMQIGVAGTAVGAPPSETVDTSLSYQRPGVVSCGRGQRVSYLRPGTLGYRRA